MCIDSVALRGSEVNAWVAGETVPRHFEQVDAVLRLARDYQGLDLDLSGITAWPQDKRTMAYYGSGAKFVA